MVVGVVGVMTALAQPSVTKSAKVLVGVVAI